MFHFHPPLATDKSLHNQTQLSHVTEDELLELRRLPTYTRAQTIFHVIFFLIFGIPKLILAILYTLLAGPSFIFACSIWRVLGRPESGRLWLKSYWATLSRIFMALVGIWRVNFVGELDSSARFVTPNHTCFFDGWLLMGLGLRPLGKKELLQVPCLKDMCEVYEGIPVDRRKSTGVSQVLLRNATDFTKPPVLILPEGATTSGDYMLRFHLGAFLSDLPVQPVAIRYKIWGTTRELHHISFFHNHPYHLLVFLGIPFITAEVTFLEPFSLKEAQGATPRDLADKVGLAIANHLGVRMIDLSSSAIYKGEVKKKE
jgi:1-acyl-sn-glycerol-3-phosphate acyltransferase